MPDLDIFELELVNNIVIFEISTLEIVLLENLVEKEKCRNLGLRMPHFGNFDQKCLIWVFLGKSFKNTVVAF